MRFANQKSMHSRKTEWAQKTPFFKPFFAFFYRGGLMRATEEKSKGEKILANLLSRRLAAPAQGNGLDRLLAVHGQQDADHRVRVVPTA